MECNCCLLHDGIGGVRIGADGRCNFCDLHDRLVLEYQGGEDRFASEAERIRDAGTGERYDCLIGISGGFDSSYMIYMAKNHGLRPLLFHFDNGYNTTEAENNMKVMAEWSGFDLIRYRVSIPEIRRVNLAILRASVSEADIPNDLIMLRLFIETARNYKIKYIMNGHNFRTEGSCPIGWTMMDTRYLRDTAGKGCALPLPSLWYQMMAGRGIKTVRPYYWFAVNNLYKEDLKKELTRLCGWQDYGGAHCENLYTKFVGNYLLPRKFGIDKRLLYVSANIRSGTMCKTWAREALEQPFQFTATEMDGICLSLGIDLVEMSRIMVLPVRHGGQYKSYRAILRRIRPLVWLAMKAGMFSRTYYEKYCRG